MQNTYWKKALAHSIGRRRLLATAGGSATAAALLVACGGNDSGETGDKSGLLTSPKDTSSEAKRGGVYKISLDAEPLHFDPAVTLNGSRRAYASLSNYKPGHLVQSDGSYVGDMAESFEFSPDGLQVTFKLRPNVAFQNIAPVNGRLMDTSDVMFTWKRYEEIGSNRTTYFSSVSGGTGPITSFSATDARTFVVKLGFPMYGGLLSMITPAGPGHGLYIIPKEADGGYDVRQKVIGTGPWQLDQHRPSSGVTWKRNPTYYDKNIPYIGTVETSLLSEYASGMAQFRAGHVYSYGVKQEDILQTKRDVPQLNLYVNDIQAIGKTSQFGWTLEAENRMWRDERVRQAYSMSWDRDAWIDIFYNVSRFKEAGLDSATVWNTNLTADLPAGGYLLNPKDEKAFGPNAKYFKHDVADAKKLMAAAGYGSGVDVIANYRDIDDERERSVLENMNAEAGFRFTGNPMAASPYNAMRDSLGKMKGIGYVNKGTVTTGGSDPIELLIRLFSPKAQDRYYLGFDVNGKGDGSGDPYLEDLLHKARSEVDVSKRQAAAHEAQRHVAKTQYMTRFPGGARTYSVVWPIVRNVNAFQGDVRNDVTIWLDETKPPIGKV